jgi:hypothetical protein
MEKEITITIDEKELAALFLPAIRLKNEKSDDTLSRLLTRLQMAYDTSRPTLSEQIMSHRDQLHDSDLTCLQIAQHAEKLAKNALEIADNVFNHLYVKLNSKQ